MSEEFYSEDDGIQACETTAELYDWYSNWRLDRLPETDHSGTIQDEFDQLPEEERDDPKKLKAIIARRFLYILNNHDPDEDSVLMSVYDPTRDVVFLEELLVDPAIKESLLERLRSRPYQNNARVYSHDFRQLLEKDIENTKNREKKIASFESVDELVGYLGQEDLNPVLALQVAHVYLKDLEPGSTEFYRTAVILYTTPAERTPARIAIGYYIEEIMTRWFKSSIDRVSFSAGLGIIKKIPEELSWGSLMDILSKKYNQEIEKATHDTPFERLQFLGELREQIDEYKTVTKRCFDDDGDRLEPLSRVVAGHCDEPAASYLEEKIENEAGNKKVRIAEELIAEIKSIIGFEPTSVGIRLHELRREAEEYKANFDLEL